MLLLRLAVGVSLVVQGEACLAGRDPRVWMMWTVGSLAILTGASLVIGFLTPVAGVLAELLSAGTALSWLPSPHLTAGAPAAVYVAVMAAAILLLGPGAFSFDARWFGRREVVIPRASNPPPDD